VVLSISATPAFTGRLSVTYRAPIQVGEPLEVRARLRERTGRKMTVAAQMRSAGRLLAAAEGLFIVVHPDRFFVAES
jgi:acyl-CoA thioesterase FadM